MKDKLRVLLMGILLILNFILLITTGFTEKGLSTFLRVSLIITFLLNEVLIVLWINIEKGD